MKVKTKLRAGALTQNHNEVIVDDAIPNGDSEKKNVEPTESDGRVERPKFPVVRTRLKAGALTENHNETLVRENGR